FDYLTILGSTRVGSANRTPLCNQKLLPDRAFRAGARRRRNLAGSGSPGELGRRETRLGLVLDAERVDVRSLRLGHCEVRADGMEHALESHRLSGLDAERHDVLDLEVDCVADANGVVNPVVDDLDRRPL